MVSGSSNASKTKPFSAPPAVLSPPDRRERHDRSRAREQRRRCRPRRAISDDEVERLFGLLGDGKIDNHQNWKGRFKDNSDKMRSGSIYEVADVLKSLTFLAKSKSLSFREKRMLDRAKFLIISEVSEVMRETAAAIEGKVDSALERCFTAKARTAARAKVVVKAAVTRPVATATATAAPRRAARAS
jgi:CarD family transcriptional regulator